MYTWEVAYYGRGVYRYKDVKAHDSAQAIKRARVKNIITLRICTNKKWLAYQNPSAYTYRDPKIYGNY